MLLTKKALAAILFGAALGCTGAAAQSPTAPQPPRFVVLLDAAHGGDDAGALLKNNTPEKAWTLSFAQRLRSLLQARGFEVRSTRDSDQNLAPAQRAAMANHTLPQACLILHATQSGSGVHLFVSSMAAAQPSKLIAWRTVQAGYVNRSISLAGELNSALEHSGLPVSLGRTSLAGMDSMACPAVAVELAPLTDAMHQTPAQLDDKDYFSRSAEAIAAALVAWRSEVHP